MWGWSTDKAYRDEASIVILHALQADHPSIASGSTLACCWILSLRVKFVDFVFVEGPRFVTVWESFFNLWIKRQVCYLLSKTCRTALHELLWKAHQPSFQPLLLLCLLFFSSHSLRQRCERAAYVQLIFGDFQQRLKLAPARQNRHSWGWKMAKQWMWISLDVWFGIVDWSEELSRITVIWCMQAS